MFTSTALESIPMLAVMSPSTLSVAVAPNSLYAVPNSMLCGLTPVKVISGIVTSAVIVTVLVTSTAAFSAVSLTL